MAGFTNSFPNLPGMLVEFKDGGLKLRTDMYDANTKSLLILGTAEDGPVLEPVATDPNTSSVVFGKDVKSNGISNGATLIPAFKQAWEAGCRDIRLMRITGSCSKIALETKVLSTSEARKIDEDKGTIEGNEETTFTLTKTPIENSLKLYVKGNLLTSGYTLATKNVTIERNVCDAGATITASYKYFKDVQVAEELTVATNKVTLTQTPITGSVKVVVKGVELESSKVSVVGKDVTLTDVADQSKVTVVYSFVSDIAVNASETGNGETNFVTGTGNQVLNLKKIPMSNTVRLYIGGKEVNNPDSITVDEKLKTVTIKKEYYSKNLNIQVSYLYEEVTSGKQYLNIESNYGGEVYNQCKAQVKDYTDPDTSTVLGKEIILTKPESKKITTSEEPLRYNTVDYPTFEKLVNAINSDPSNGVFKAKTDFNDCLGINLNDVEMYLTGGDSGLHATTQELFDALSGTRDEKGYIVKQGAYQLLEDYLVDWVAPVGVYADDYVAGINKDFGYELALFCAVLSVRNKTTIGAIALRPCTNTSLSGIQEYAKKVCSFKNQYLMRDLNGNLMRDNDNKPIDLGKYLSVVVGPDPIYADYDLGRKAGNPAIQYAAINTNLAPHKAPTNKPLYGAKGLRYRFSNAQLDEITGNRLVSFKMKQLRNNTESPAIVDGVTSAMPGSDYTRVTTIKCVKETVDEIREVADPFLGEPSTIEQRNALASLISKRLGLLRENGIIQDFAFQLVVSAQDYLLGQARIELTLVPPHELRQITTVVGLRSSL